jgi:hypothetical protein
MTLLATPDHQPAASARRASGQPQHRSHRTLLRLSAGALLAVAAVTVVPTVASANVFSTCTYNPDNKTAVVTDRSGDAALQVSRMSKAVGNPAVITAADDDGIPQPCRTESGLGDSATVDNTVKIAVFAAAPSHVAGGYTIDMSHGRFVPTKATGPEQEIPITIVTEGVAAPTLTVLGTSQHDVMSVGAGGRLNFSFDNDADVIPITKPLEVAVHGGLGNDELDANGGGIFAAPADLPVRLHGDAGNDSVIASSRGNTSLFGGADDDTLFSANNNSDGVSGGPGIDTATTDRFVDVVLTVEKQLFLPLG